MSRLIFLVLITPCCLWGQQTPKDSSVKTVDLNEVCIYESGSDGNESFNFYKNSKLANTEDILSRMEGVNLIKRGAYGLEPIIRNYSGAQTNLTIDGMRIYGACTDKMDPVSIYVEPVNLQSIEVAHGSSGALNGSTIGGQINFNLKDPEYTCNKKLHGQIAQSYATVNNGFNTTAALNQSIGRFAYRISGGLRDADNYYAGGKQLIQNSGYHKSNLSGAFSFMIDSLQSIRLNYLGDWGKNIGYPALPMDVGAANAQIVSLTHKKIFLNKWLDESETKVYYNTIYHQMDDTQRSDVPMHMDMPGWSTTAGFYENLATKKGLKLRVDYHYAETRADMVMYPTEEPIMYLQTLPENRFFDLGLAVHDQYDFQHKQFIGFNGRIDLMKQYALYGAGEKQWKVFDKDITINKQDLLKNLNLRYGKRFGQNLLTQVTFGYGERIASSNERYGYYLFNRQDQYDYMGNPDLTPENSYQCEFLVRHTIGKLEYSLNLFYHYTRNYMYASIMPGYGAMTIGALGLKTYSNIDHSVSQGGEMTTKYRITENLTSVTSFKYVHARNCFDLPLPLVPPFKIQQALRYKIRLTQVQLEYDFAAAQNRINPDYGDCATPAFHLLNLRASRNFALKPGIFQIGAACENILDTYYREHLDIGAVPRFGRNFSFNLSFLF